MWCDVSTELSKMFTMILQTVIFILMMLKIQVTLQTAPLYKGGDNHCKVHTQYHLKLLNCSHQNLSYIPKTDASIQGLVFGFNELANVTKETFDNISKPENIVELQLDNNKIVNISSDALDEFRNLKFLYLSSNPIYYDNLKNLLGSLSELKYLSDLRISGIRTVTIQKDLFSLMKDNRIETLEVRFYSLKTISLDIFRAFNSLKSFYLRDNSIENLILSKINHLTSLYIDHNKMKVLPDFSVNGNQSDCYLPNLEILNIQDNMLTEFSVDTFKCLRNLKHMKFGLNPVKTLRNNILSSMPNLLSLSILYMTGGHLQIEPFAFNSSSLVKLKLDHKAPAGDIFLSPEDAFKHTPNLFILNIGRVSMLYMTNEKLTELFWPLEKLGTFYCYGCQISQDPKYIVGNMKRATEIFLQSNLITSLSEETFKHNTQLRYLSLRFNEIGHIPESALPVSLLNKLHLLDLSINPFICDCGLDWLITWMKTKKDLKVVSRYPQEYVCSKPARKYGMRLSDVSFTYKECHPWSPWIWTAVIGSPCVVVLAVVAFVVYRNRWNIKHYIFLMRRKKNYQRIPGNVWMYDAFVAYEAEDSAWVRRILLPVLEEEVGLKLCIHERDFQIGAFINDNIVTNINASEKIILVLTNSFARSGWCMFELKVAHSKLIEEETEVVIILLEKIDAANMNHSLKVLFDTTTYIEWTEDGVGQELFWAKLKETLRK